MFNSSKTIARTKIPSGNSGSNPQAIQAEKFRTEKMGVALKGGGWWNRKMGISTAMRHLAQAA